MISNTMQDAINAQINKELYSYYLYLAMSAHFTENNLEGFGHWLKVQADEEMTHAMKFFDFLLDRGGHVKLDAIASPPSTWKTSNELFEQVLAHEQMITASINSLYELALKEKDYPSQVLLQWYINEQVEEEKNATFIIHQLKLIDARGTAVLMLDKQLGKRAGE